MELGQEKEGRGLRKGMSTKGEIISLKDFKEDRDLFRVEEKPFTGVWVDYYDYENGQKEYEGHYKDGKLNGLYVEWYEDGQKKCEERYKNGKENGLCTWWYENGQKELEGHFEDEKLNGLYVEWYEDGQKKCEEHYKNGKENGLCTWWCEDGQKECEGYYEDGVEVDGLWTELDENEPQSPRSASKKFIWDVCFPVLVFCLPAFVFLGVGFSVYFFGVWIIELVGPNPDTPNIELTPNTEFGIILLGIKNLSLLKA